MAGSFGGGLGVLGQGFFQGLDRSVAHGSANQGNILKVMALARQYEAVERQQLADAVKMIDTDPEGALQVLPSLKINPATRDGLIARAQANANLMRQGKAYVSTAVSGGELGELDPNALRFLKPEEIKFIEGARQTGIDRGLGQHFAPTIAETPREQLHTVLPKRAAEYKGPGDPWAYMNKNKLAESAGGFLPHKLEDEQTQRREVESAINALNYGADPKKVAAALIARNIPVAAINRADPRGAALIAEMEAQGTAKGKAIGEGQGVVAPVPGTDKTVGQVKAGQEGQVAEQTQLGKERAPGYAGLQASQTKLNDARAALARVQAGNQSSQERLRDMQILKEGFQTLKLWSENKFNEAVFGDMFKELLGVAPSPDRAANIKMIDDRLMQITRELVRSVTGVKTPGAMPGAAPRPAPQPAQPTQPQVFDRPVKIRDPRTGRQGTLPPGKPLPPGAEIVQ